MKKPVSPEDFGEIIETMIETQALLVSSIYVDLVNSGLLEAGAAARRLHALGDLAASPLQQHPEVAATLGDRLRGYADGFERAHRSGAHPKVQLRVVNGGKR
jgi:hypothetical protein